MFEPVIKWSGSKRSQAENILTYFPKEIDTYYEPFCGGASVLRRLLSSNIKVNHYVTKSLEEWYSKLVDRGYISHGSRKYFDDFFVVNYDMIDIYFEKFLNNNIKTKSTHIS